MQNLQLELHLDLSVTIIDNEDPTLLFKTSEFNPTEVISGGMFEIEVELTGQTDETVIFDIALSDGTAIKGNDYENPGSLRGIIAIGAIGTSIHIPILPDNVNEGNETFTLKLSNLSGAVFEGSGTKLEQEITIIDDEMPTLAFTNESFSVLESESNIEVAVELSGPTGLDVSFTYEIIDG